MSRGPSPVVSAPADCRVRFGQLDTRAPAGDSPVDSLHVALPVLSGPSDELLLGGAEPARSAHGFTLFGADPLLAGLAAAPPDLDLEEAAARLYDGLFAATRGLHLYRIWNYVPHINAVHDGLENYQRFCRGRSLAFERQFGAGFRKLLPAASAVGSVAGPLALGFLAGRTAPRHFENPRQVPAFEYPPQYGPRPPSFARATTVKTESGRQVLISGTAAISGHSTVAAGDLDRQLDCTLENLRLIAAAAGAGDALGSDPGWTRRFKVYVRRAADAGRVTARINRELKPGRGAIQYLRADLCRAELLVEIEAVLIAAD